MQGNLFIVAAPSGAGKSSLVNAVLAQEPDVRLSVSYTTRVPRPTEQHSREYHFVERPVFEAMMAAGDFLECAEVYGNFYGTSRRWISQTLDSGLDVVLEIDWQGARQVRALFPQTMSVYLLPPSLRILEVRLRGRGQDSDEVIARRLAAAQEDMAHLIEFDYVIINNDFQEAVGDLRAILRAARLTGERQRTRHALLIQNLLTR
jgi:guanylate kinase